VRASDGGTPSKSTSAVVQVTVLRNLQSPVVALQTTPLRVPETIPLGSVLTTVTATDGDRRVGVFGYFSNFLNAVQYIHYNSSNLQRTIILYEGCVNGIPFNFSTSAYFTLYLTSS